jgi:hypothetical protein
VIANPPFSLNEWGREVAEHDRHGRFKFGLPPKTKGDLAFVQHMIATTNETGMVGVVMPHGVLFRGAAEGEIRKGLLREDLLETVVGLFEQLRGDLRGRTAVAESLGMTETSFAIYGLIADPHPTRAGEPASRYGGAIDESRKELAGILEEQLEPQVTIVDWVSKDDVQREMRRVIKRQLRAAGFAAERVDPMAESVVDLMKRRRGR